MAAPMKRVVGWTDRLEWVHVYEELYSNDSAKQKHALDRIAIWKCRTAKLSTAIECTWELVSAEIQYQWARDESSIAEQDRQLRIMYAMALTRFINLITEKGQNARYAFPVHQLANDLCLPKWMVSLRHDAVHSNLPALTILKAGVQTALAWLKEEYWEAQLAEEDPELSDHLKSRPEVPDSETAEIMTQLLEAYTAEYHQQYSDKEGSKSSNAYREQLKPILKDVEKLIANSSREVILRVLLQEGFMMHTPDQLQAFSVDMEDLLNDTTLRLPKELLSLWHPIIRFLRKERAIPALLVQLLSSADQSSPLKIRLFMGWAVEIILAAGPKHDGLSPSKMLASIFNEEDQETFIKARKLLAVCLEHPNHYTTALLPLLFKSSSPPLSQLQEKLLLKTVKIYSEPDITEKQANEDNEDNEDVHDVNGLDITEGTTSWDACPLGHCPLVPVTYTNLELPEYVNSLGSATTVHRPLTRPPSTPSRSKGQKPQLGKRSPRRDDEDNFEPATKETKLQWSPTEFNNIKEKISLF